jgi:[ribosomal protein S5]-alanine N-acetyltransferase
MHPPERFETARLRFRPVELADAPAIYHGYASRSAATRFMHFVQHEDPSEAEAFARRCVECWQDGSAFPSALVAKEDGRFIGTIELRIKPPKADFGYILCEDAWCRGYATEAASALVRWAQAQPRIFRIWATCHPNNRASARVLEKAGLQYEGRLKNWEPRPQLGEPAGDSLAYVLAKPVSL